MASLEPEHNVTVPVLGFQWLTVSFLHWRYQPDVVQALLPDGLRVQTFDGSAWVGLVPFTMADVCPFGVRVGSLGTFAETNVRTYVEGPGGRDGLWFFSLDAPSMPMVLASRLTVGARYHLGEHTVEKSSHRVAYTGARHGGSPSYRVVVRPGARIEPDDLTVWLTGRWRAYTSHVGRLFESPVAHEPWPLRRATVAELEQTLTGAVGLPTPEGEPLVHYSEGVRRARLGVARIVG